MVREIVESLGEGPGTRVCRLLVAAADAVDAGDGETARAYGEEARRRGSRLTVVREATGVLAYRTGDFTTAVKDLQAARRIGGSISAAAVLADCERALGRPERALEVAAATDPARLDTADRVELLIVTAGARLDLGQADAAVTTLRTPDLRVGSEEPWQERLWYAFASALQAAGRGDEAREWLTRAAAHPAGQTPAREEVGMPAVADHGGSDDGIGVVVDLVGEGS